MLQLSLFQFYSVFVVLVACKWRCMAPHWPFNHMWIQLEKFQINIFITSWLCCSKSSHISRNVNYCVVVIQRCIEIIWYRCLTWSSLLRFYSSWVTWALLWKLSLPKSCWIHTSMKNWNVIWINFGLCYLFITIVKINDYNNFLSDITMMLIFCYCTVLQMMIIMSTIANQIVAFIIGFLWLMLLKY